MGPSTGRAGGPVPIDIGVAVENVGRLVDAVTAGEGCRISRMLEARELRGEGFAKTEDAFEC